MSAPAVSPGSLEWSATSSATTLPAGAPGIPTYSQVSYRSIYPGIDLVFYGNQHQLEYDFVVAPGADPTRIAWRIEGARPSVDSAGDLALPRRHASGNPLVYQIDHGRRAMVDGAFVVDPRSGALPRRQTTTIRVRSSLTRC